MSNTAKAFLLIAFCTLLGYLGGKYPIGTPTLSKCQELVKSDIVAHRRFEAEITKLVGTDFLTELSEPSATSQ